METVILNKKVKIIYVINWFVVYYLIFFVSDMSVVNESNQKNQGGALKDNTEHIPAGMESDSDEDFDIE